MCIWNEKYWEANLTDQANTQTVISLTTEDKEKFLDKMGYI